MFVVYSANALQSLCLKNADVAPLRICWCNGLQKNIVREVNYSTKKAPEVIRGFPVCSMAYFTEDVPIGFPFASSSTIS
jgi:hypothetical protein